MNVARKGLALAMLFAALSGAMSAPARRGDTRGVPPAEVVGRGWGDILACAACAAGAVFLASGGPGAVLAAAYAPGSAVVVAACITSCANAVNEI